MHKKDSNYGNINVHSPAEVADNGKKDIFYEMACPRHNIKILVGGMRKWKEVPFTN